MIWLVVQLLKSWEYKNKYHSYAIYRPLYSYLNLESTKTDLKTDQEDNELYSYLNLESTKTQIR